MSRINGKNKNKIPEEKEIIINDYLSGTGIMEIERKYGISYSSFYTWKKQYEENGLESFKTCHSRKSHQHYGLHLRRPKNRIEEL